MCVCVNVWIMVCDYETPPCVVHSDSPSSLRLCLWEFFKKAASLLANFVVGIEPFGLSGIPRGLWVCFHISIQTRGSRGIFFSVENLEFFIFLGGFTWFLGKVARGAAEFCFWRGMNWDSWDEGSRGGSEGEKRLFAPNKMAAEGDSRGGGWAERRGGREESHDDDDDDDGSRVSIWSGRWKTLSTLSSRNKILWLEWEIILMRNFKSVDGRKWGKNDFWKFEGQRAIHTFLFFIFH